MAETARVRLPIPSGRVALIGGGGLAAIIALVVLYATFLTSVGPNEFAVRQVFLGPKKGVQTEILGPGLHFVMPGYERLHLFPRGLQLLEFNDSKVSASLAAHSQPSIRIQTSEGYQVTVDVTVAYRIIDPYAVITNVGPGSLYETSLMVPRSDKVLRQNLGQLNAEQFYQGDLRREKAEQARLRLSEDVEADGIQVWSVLVRHYTYDSRYQKAIEDRKIQDQTVFKNRAEAVAASQEAEKNRVLAKGQAQVEVERQRGRSEVQKINSDADLYYRQKGAEGDLLVALAEAEGTKAENRALQTAGAANLVGLEMAEVLDGVEVIIVPTDGKQGVNPLDLDELVRGW